MSNYYNVPFVAPLNEEIEVEVLEKEPSRSYFDNSLLNDEFTEEELRINESVETELFFIGEWEKKESLFSLRDVGVDIPTAFPSFAVLSEGVKHPTSVLKTKDPRLQGHVDMILSILNHPHGWAVVLREAIEGRYSVIDRFCLFCQRHGRYYERNKVIETLIKCLFNRKHSVSIGVSAEIFADFFFFKYLADKKRFEKKESKNEPWYLDGLDRDIVNLMCGTMSGWDGLINSSASLLGGEEFTAITMCHFVTVKQESSIDALAVLQKPSILLTVSSDSRRKKFFLAVMNGVSLDCDSNWFTSRLSGTSFGEYFQISDIHYGQFPLHIYEEYCCAAEIRLDRNALPVTEETILSVFEGRVCSTRSTFFCSSNYILFCGEDGSYIGIVVDNRVFWLNGCPLGITGIVTVVYPDDAESKEFEFTYEPFDPSEATETCLVHLPTTVWGFRVFCNFNAPLPLNVVDDNVRHFPGMISGNCDFEILCCLHLTCYDDIVKILLEALKIEISPGMSLILNQDVFDVPLLDMRDNVSPVSILGLVPFRENRPRVVPHSIFMHLQPATSLSSYGLDGTLIPYYVHEICDGIMSIEKWNTVHRMGCQRIGDIDINRFDENLSEDLEERVNDYYENRSNSDDEDLVDDRGQEDFYERRESEEKLFRLEYGDDIIERHEEEEENIQNDVPLLDSENEDDANCEEDYSSDGDDFPLLELEEEVEHPDF